MDALLSPEAAESRYKELDDAGKMAVVALHAQGRTARQAMTMIHNQGIQQDAAAAEDATTPSSMKDKVAATVLGAGEALDPTLGGALALPNVLKPLLLNPLTLPIAVTAGFAKKKLLDDAAGPTADDEPDSPEENAARARRGDLGGLYGAGHLAGDAANAAQAAGGAIALKRALPGLLEKLSPLVSKVGGAAAAGAKAALPAKAARVVDAVAGAMKGEPLGPAADAGEIAKNEWIRAQMPNPYGAELGPEPAKPLNFTTAVDEGAVPVAEEWTPPASGSAVSAAELRKIPLKTPTSEANAEALSRMKALKMMENAFGDSTSSMRTPMTGPKPPPMPPDAAVDIAPANIIDEAPLAQRAQALDQLSRVDMPADVMAGGGPPPASKPPIGIAGAGGTDTLAARVSSMPSSARVAEVHRIAKTYGIDVAKKVAKRAGVSLKLNPL